MNADVLSNMKILIVDDEPVNLVLLTEILEPFAYRNLKTTTDSREVMPLIREFQPDLLLLDLMMPHLDGFAVMEQLSEFVPSDSYLPVLVLTADANAATRRRALSAGATDFLTKPFDQTEVVLRIRNLLRTRLLHTKLQENNTGLNDLVRERTRNLEGALAELKATQRQVIQQERLAALGTMAAGVGHDFRNTLMAVMGYTELVLQSIQTIDRNAAAEHLRIVYAAAQDSAKIVDRLSAFHRVAENGDPRAGVDLNELVQQTAMLTSPKWKTQPMAAGASINLVLQPGEIPPISGDSTELREVLTNLIFNAVDAMPAGGTLTLRTESGAGRVVVEIRDSGIGMTDEVRQRCLEPFFTTKGTQGTGLGLAIVYGIVQRHRGLINVESEPGIGTVFSLSFPADATAATQAVGPVSTNTHRPLRVLVVDDQPTLCELMVEYLKGDWHIVETATCGTQALKKFRSAPFDLVITDRVMPEMSGDELALAIKSLAPQQPVLMVTGFANADRCGGGLDAVLEKPISLTSLRQAITKALAA